jgi:hypothetical protein
MLTLHNIFCLYLMMEKRCSNCNEEKDLSKFQKYQGLYMSWCHRCKNEKDRKRRAKNKPQPLW